MHSWHQAGLLLLLLLRLLLPAAAAAAAAPVHNSSSAIADVQQPILPLLTDWHYHRCCSALRSLLLPPRPFSFVSAETPRREARALSLPHGIDAAASRRSVVFFHARPAPDETPNRRRPRLQAPPCCCPCGRTLTFRATSFTGHRDTGHVVDDVQLPPTLSLFPKILQNQILSFRVIFG